MHELFGLGYIHAPTTYGGCGRFLLFMNGRRGTMAHVRWGNFPLLSLSWFSGPSNLICATDGCKDWKHMCMLTLIIAAYSWGAKESEHYDRMVMVGMAVEKSWYAAIAMLLLLMCLESSKVFCFSPRRASKSITFFFYGGLESCEQILYLDFHLKKRNL